MARKPRVGLGLVTAAALLLAAPVQADPGDWLVEAPSAVHMGDEAPFAVVFADGESATVTLYYRAQGASRYTAMPLLANGAGRYHGRIPAGATRTTGLRYYVESISSTDQRRRRFGSPERPLTLTLLEPVVVEAKDTSLKMVLGVIPLFVIGGFVVRRDRARRRKLLDNLFWVQLLGPLARVPKRRALEQATRLAEKTLEHPVDGPKQYSKEQILEQLKRIRSLDRSRLEDERKRFLGEVDKLLPKQKERTSEDQTKTDLSDLTGRIGQLCAIGYVLARSREDRIEGGSKAVSDLVRPLTESRDVIQRAQKLLDGGEREQAAATLVEVKEVVERVHRSMAAIDQYESIDHYSATLTGSAAVTPDLLCRLLEYHALNAPRSVENRQKLVVVGRLLAERDPIEADQPDGVRRSLIRRKLLLSTRTEKLPQDLAERATRVLKEIAATEPTDIELEVLEAKVEALIEEVGKSVYTIDGIAYAVACDVGLRAKRTEAQQRELVQIEESTEELDELVEVGRETMQFVVDEADEPVARDFVEGIEADMLRAASEGKCVERGFYLDEAEIEAATGRMDDPKWGALIISAAACRTAIDWVASRHAKAKQPKGQAPPPLPETLAVGLLRTATQIESDIQEQIERDLIRSRADRAKLATRIIQRLSRARLGLAVLGGLPATGYGARRDPAETQAEEQAELATSTPAGVA